MKTIQNQIRLDNPIDMYVNPKQIISESFLSKNNVGKIKCKLIGFSTYIGEALTALIMLEDGSVFSYIPLTALSLNGTFLTKYTIDQVHFTNCPDYKISINYLFDRDTDLVYYNTWEGAWKTGKYILSIDFVESNELLNLIVDFNGRLLLRPMHKVKFITLSELNKGKNDKNIYKSQKETYVVSDYHEDYKENKE